MTTDRHLTVIATADDPIDESSSPPAGRGNTMQPEPTRTGKAAPKPGEAEDYEQETAMMNTIMLLLKPFRHDARRRIVGYIYGKVRYGDMDLPF